MLVISPEELAERSAQILCRRPGETLLAEEYLSGELHTLETLSDGKRTWVLGGFRTTLPPLPFFIEERLTWAAPAPEAAREHVLAAVPPAGPRPTGQRDVLLSVRSLREAGDRVAVSHTNRDYLGIISAIGTDAAAVEGAVAAARAEENWPVTGPRS